MGSVLSSIAPASDSTGGQVPGAASFVVALLALKENVAGDDRPQRLDGLTG
jgi:hypothetical protein